jgi:catechol-2,3-dioxygenase
MPKPIKLAHVLFKTNDLAAMRDWYCTVLEAEVAFENRFVAFLTYDDEHHRVALLRQREAPCEGGGVDHVAFTYANLSDLITTHDRLRALGITPTWCVNHGPTTSMYYADPHGNRIELQVDNYATDEELHAFFRSDDFAKDPVGIDFDVDELHARLDAGEPEAELLLRPDVLASRGGS